MIFSFFSLENTRILCDARKRTDLNLERTCSWDVSFYHLPIPIHQKLFKIPFDQVTEKSSCA